MPAEASDPSVDTARFDTVLTIETPELVDLQLRLAGPVVRSFAFGIDGAIRLVLYALLSNFLITFDGFGLGLFLICVFAAEWVYPVLFEVFMGGATPGKRLFDLRVVNDDGTPVTWTPSIIRNLLRFADFMPMLWGFGLTSMLLHSQFKRLGDIAAGTVVTYATQTQRDVRRPDGEPIFTTVPLTLEEQRAVVEFAERSAHLGSERAYELASAALPLLDPAQPPVERLCRIANGLAGKP